MRLKYLVLGIALVGAVVEWYLYLPHALETGFNFKAIQANGTATSLFAELISAIIVFATWSFFDAQQLKITKCWFVSLLGIFIGGISMQAGLYFFFRLRSQEKTLE